MTHTGPLSAARLRLKRQAHAVLVDADEARELVSLVIFAGAVKLVATWDRPNALRAARARLAATTPQASTLRRKRTRAQAEADARYLAKRPTRRSAEERERAEQARLDDLAVWARYLAKRDRRGQLAPVEPIAEPSPLRSPAIGQLSTTTT